MQVAKAHEVSDFLSCGGFASVKSKSDEWRVRTHRRVDGSIEYRGPGIRWSGGFEVKQDGEESVVRFFGPCENESGTLAEYTRVLLNCGYAVEHETDPDRDGFQLLRVAR